MYDVFEKSVAQLQRDMEAGITTSEEITLAYLLRIARLDKAGPKVNSVLEINPDAVFIARALDRERKLTGPRGPMCGYPILSVPAGNGSDGCPVGMSFIAGAFSEPKLLAYGYAFEQASHLRVIPQCAKE